MAKLKCSIAGIFLLCISGKVHAQACDLVKGFQNIIWFKGVGDFYNHFDGYYSGISRILEDKTGDIITIGNITMPTSGLTQTLIMKTTLKGTVLWAKTTKGYSFSDGGGFNTGSIISTRDNDYVAILGGSWGGANATGLVKFGPDGAVQWALGFSGTTTNYGLSINKVIQLSNGNYIVTGYAQDLASSRRGVVCCIDENGKLLWNKYFFFQ
ncbi:hypothetical protein [Parafilimonas sp.]|uniref:hypothetical protein n=1 Tax=Parafilimonas sp. TaxID=1969739 RepID=UPI0039E60228